ncbi:MAG: hypothetical protein JWQ84_877 [Mucilaginibacter sp.]|nr:hypothetical protein [Mucilaginibacter sp.]
MKKNLLFILIIPFFLISCKKNAPVAPVNTLSASIDGVEESFNTNVFAQNGSGVSLNSALIILGDNGSASGSDILSITVNTNSTITARTYSNAPTSTDGFISIVYNNGPVSLVNPNTYTSDVNGVHLTTVKIISISNANIQGTFSAQLVSVDGKTIKSFTNGKFNINLN